MSRALLLLAALLVAGGAQASTERTYRPIKQSASVVYVCDPHDRADLGANFASVFRAVRRFYPQPDAWIINGDYELCDDEMVDSLASFRATLRGVPLYILPGDHDSALYGFEQAPADSLDMWRFTKQAMPTTGGNKAWWVDVANIRFSLMRNINNTVNDSFFVNGEWKALSGWMEPQPQEIAASGYAAYDSFAVENSTGWQIMEHAALSSTADWNIAVVAHPFESPQGDTLRGLMAWGQYGPKAAGGTIGNLIEDNFDLCLGAHEHLNAEWGPTHGDTLFDFDTDGKCYFVIGPHASDSHGGSMSPDTCSSANVDSCRADTVRGLPGSWLRYYSPGTIPAFAVIQTADKRLTWTVVDTTGAILRRWSMSKS